MTVSSLSGEQFQTQVLDKPGKVLVDFWAPWCGPCKVMGNILEEVASTIKDMSFVKINLDDHPEIATDYQVRSIPTLILFKDGQVTDIKTGIVEAPAMIEWLSK